MRRDSLHEIDRARYLMPKTEAGGAIWAIDDADKKRRCRGWATPKNDLPRRHYIDDMSRSASKSRVASRARIGL